MKIKENYLDIKVNCPISGQDVILRFVDEALYPVYSAVYPEAFETSKKQENKNVDTITDAE